MRSEDFIQSIGVSGNVGSGQFGPQASDIISELSYLGISNLRVTAPLPSALPTYTTIGKAGVAFDVVTGSTDIPSDLAVFDSIASYTASIEGINEANAYPGGPNAAAAFQAALYSSIKSDPTLAAIPVLSFSLSVGFPQTGYPNVEAYADYGNFHAYTSGGGGPNQSILYELSMQQTVPDKPKYLTEDGYYTYADGKSGVSLQYQAIGDVDILLDGAYDGLAKTFLYELSDDGTSGSEGNRGLYDIYGNPKPVANAIHNLTTLLADTGAGASTFVAATPNISVSGLIPINGRYEVFAKSNGVFDVAIWSEANLFNEQTGTIYNVATTATLSFGSTNYDVKVFDVLAGTAAIQTAVGVTSLAVTAGADPLIIQLTPDGGPATPQPSNPVVTPPVVNGTPLQLGLSEDTSSTDTQYAISVDGVQVASSSEAAKHSLGQNDAVNAPAGLQQGTHIVTVTLLNPNTNPTASNALYVDNLSLGTVETQLDTRLNAATPSVSFTVTNPQPSADGPITSDTVNGSSLPAAFLTTTTPSINSFGQVESRNAGAGTAPLELMGQQTAYAGAGLDNFIERAGIKAETVVFGFKPGHDTINLVGYSLADPNNAIFQNGTTETIQLRDGNAIDLVNTSGIPKAAFNWG